MAQVSLSLDLEEVRKLLEMATRPRVVQLLTDTLRGYEKEAAAAAATSLENVENGGPKSDGDDAKDAAPTAASSKVEAPRGVKLPTTTFDAKISIRYTPLSTFSWDQTSEYVKLYYSLEGANQEGVDVEFTSKSFDVKVRHPDGKHYRCGIPKLFRPINAQASAVIVRPKRIVIKLKKQDFGNWMDIYHKEEKFKMSESDKEDPMAGIMGMMRNLYEEGDDDMKRTIAKAFGESRKGAGGMPSMMGSSPYPSTSSSSSPSPKFDPLGL